LREYICVTAKPAISAIYTVRDSTPLEAAGHEAAEGNRGICATRVHDKIEFNFLKPDLMVHLRCLPMFFPSIEQTPSVRSDNPEMIDRHSNWDSSQNRRIPVKMLVALIALGTVITAPALAQPASRAHGILLTSHHGWSSMVQPYAPNGNTFITQDENVEGYPRSES
jgi:hypothetical protein